jgi:ribA/ribD-fused uncharacterized protein
MYFGDKKVAEEILKTSIPYEQKKLGRTVRGFDEVQWRRVCRDFVFVGVYLKFKSNGELYDILKKCGNGRIFVEASPYDSVWGIKVGVNDGDIYEPKKWKGTNYLGDVLNELRRTIDHYSEEEVDTLYDAIWQHKKSLF